MSDPSALSTGSVAVTIAQSPGLVWAAIADITRMGEWSPECTAGRWVSSPGGPSTGPMTSPMKGATFEGDNEAKFAGRTVKRWTTTSEVTECEPGELFEFIAEGTTTWRYEFEPIEHGTRVTETFSYEPRGFQGFFYEKLLRRRTAMTRGMQQTLDRIKAALESEPSGMGLDGAVDDTSP